MLPPPRVSTPVIIARHFCISIWIGSSLGLCIMSQTACRELAQTRESEAERWMEQRFQHFPRIWTFAHCGTQPKAHESRAHGCRSSLGAWRVQDAPSTDRKLNFSQDPKTLEPEVGFKGSASLPVLLELCAVICKPISCDYICDALPE